MAETKHFDATVTTFNLGATWFFKSLICAIAQGTGSGQRIGDKIFVKSIRVMIMMVSTPANLLKTGGLCKAILYHNRQTNGVQIAATTVYNNDDIMGLRNLQKTPTCSILKQHQGPMLVTSIDATGNSTGPPMCVNLVCYPKKVITYSDNTGLIADVVKDDYGFAVVGTTANMATVAVRFQVTYTDA